MSGSEEESSSSGEGDGATNPETNESLLENGASAPDGGVGASGEVGAVSSGGLSRLADRIALALTKKLGGGRSTSARKSAGSDKSSSAGETAPGLLSAPDELYDVRDPDRAHNAPIVDRDGAPPLFHKTKSKISLAEPLSAGVVSPARDSAASSDRKTGKKDDWGTFRPVRMTRELAQELQVIRARGFLDPTKYFKNPGKRRRYNTDVQVGRVLDHATHWYVDRSTKKEANRSNLDSILHDREKTQYLKHKFLEFQSSRATRGKNWKSKNKRKRAKIDAK